jgi:hypothetical protein
MTAIVYARYRYPSCHAERLERDDLTRVAHRCKPADRQATVMHKITDHHQGAGENQHQAKAEALNMTMIDDNEFTTPAAPGGDEVPLNDLLGALLLFTVKEHLPEMETVHGPARPVSCAIAVLDGDHKGDTYPDALMFPRVLISQLKHAVGGGKVLGRLTQGEKKPGKNAPWKLDDPTEDDKATARKYLAYVAEQAKAEASPF